MSDESRHPRSVIILCHDRVSARARENEARSKRKGRTIGWSSSFDGEGRLGSCVPAKLDTSSMAIFCAAILAALPCARAAAASRRGEPRCPGRRGPGAVRVLLLLASCTCAILQQPSAFRSMYTSRHKGYAAAGKSENRSKTIVGLGRRARVQLTRGDASLGWPLCRSPSMQGYKTSKRSSTAQQN